MRIGQRRASAEQVVAWLAVAAAVAFVLWQVFPQAFHDTTPTRGDLGEHLIEPAHLRDYLLPHWRLSGWSQAWFTGYPSFTFYFPLAGLLPVFFDVLLPYNVAFKLAAVAGPLSLPLAAYAFGRLNQRSRSTAACYGVAALVPLLQPLLFNIGGSVWAAVLGEYAYGLSLSLGLLALGLASAGLRTGRYRGLAAVVLALGLLAHVLPTVTVVIGLLLLLALHRGWARVRWMATMGVVALALAGFWLVPLVLRMQYTAGPVYPRHGALSDWLFPTEMAPVLVLAVVGLALTAWAVALGESPKRNNVELFMALMAVTSALLVAALPEGRVEHTRFLAPWYLWIALCAANGVARLAEVIDRRRAAGTRGHALATPLLAQLAVPLVLLVALIPAWDSRLGKGILTKTKGDTRNYADFFLEGYEKSADRAEFQTFIDTVRGVAKDTGCGRAKIEWNKGGWDDFRLALTDLTPYWTKGCITVTSGLSVQSSATTPYLGVTSERISYDGISLDDKEEDDKHTFHLAAGITDLRLLGVRYYFANHPTTQRAADASPELRLVTETPLFADHRWKVYELPDAAVVEPMRYEPVVVTSIDDSGSTWERAARRWYDSGAEREVVLSAGGPRGWAHVKSVPSTLPRRPLPEVAVSNVRLHQDRVSFDVSKTGVPVLVKVSSFPNWRARGADGPYRVTPNFMVVVPRSPTVTLSYGRTPPDHLGVLATVAGVGAVGFLAKRPPVRIPAAPEPEVAAPTRGSKPGKRPSKKKRR